MELPCHAVVAVAVPYHVVRLAYLYVHIIRARLNIGTNEGPYQRYPADIEAAVASAVVKA